MKLLADHLPLIIQSLIAALLLLINVQFFWTFGFSDTIYVRVDNVVLTEPAKY